LIPGSTFKVFFHFILKASVKFFFFGVEEGEVSAVLGVLETVVSRSRNSISGAECFTTRRLFGSVVS
jgi:hypothetical protein